MKSMKSVQFVEKLNQDGYIKAALHDDNYARLIFPSKVNLESSMLFPADGWNQGHDVYILVPAGERVQVVTRKDANRLGFYGPESDVVRGLWATKYQKIYLVSKKNNCPVPSGGRFEEVWTYRMDNDGTMRTKTVKINHSQQLKPSDWVYVNSLPFDDEK